MNIEDFGAYVKEMGFPFEFMVGDDNLTYMVVRGFELPSGALKGRYCDIAIECMTSVPFVVPPAIHTRPQLVPMDMSDPLRTQGSGIGPDWQYWSRRYDHRPTPRDLWAHILTVLCDDRWPTS